MLEKAKVSFFLAGRSIRRGNKGITIFTIFVLTLIFVQLVLFSSMLAGVTVQFNKLLVDFQTGNVVIEPKEEERYIEAASALQKKIESLSEVTGTSARLKASGAFRYKEKEMGATVYGVDPTDESFVTGLESTMLSGEFLSKPDRGEIILGREISGGFGALMDSRSLGGVEVGDTVEVTIQGRTKEFRVKGIYSTLYFMIDSAAYISRADMEEMLGVQDRDLAQEIAVRTTEGTDEAVTREKLISLGVRENVRTWREFAGLLSLIEGTLGMVRNIMNAIGLLIAFVIIFVVIYVNIVNKKRQIGVQKAIGIEQNVIIASFVLQAMLYAGAGVILGYILMHYGIVPYTVANPVQVPVGAISLELDDLEAVNRAVLLFMASVIGSVIPAYKLANKGLLELIWEK
ncbi:ABC transporter permease [Methanosarcina sp. 2.H.T.1A.6]|uniref:ABC transporter permease n=1 Tax=unclassified Methanosarcina TaxID=2644672 RepID=UPI000621CB00|nr:MULTISPECIES: FtsX-like permease family protein [unclassified Methanosarcina]KKG16986.1 ABC transporter permease [Methanosarcina sp. 2.H.T.1A.3]KKG20390.1 ABC transporter permease [Methanosarcina sp. 2.H.T.1A.6]KKG23345.1 ABC transporter permease [Methanosarcina sp. 2.H.T.1A.8]KKG27763.1 ABC transporter permease [Methanosarcina sp. 2.H.T.1A.15]